MINNNLPILYTRPIWVSLIRIPGKHSLCLVEGYGYVSSGKLNSISLKFEGRTSQEWYDRWILGITVPSQRPRCESPGCNEEVEWKGFDINYKKGSCTNLSHKKIVANSHKSRNFTKEQIEYRSERIKFAFDNDPSIQIRKSNSLRNTYKENPNLREQKRIQGIKRYSDPYERLKTSLATSEALRTPEMHEKLSNIQRNRYKDPFNRRVTGIASKKAWSNPSEKMKLNCLGSSSIYGVRTKLYSLWENKMIKLDSNWELKFYNLCVLNNIQSLIREPLVIEYTKPHESDSSWYKPDFLLNNHYLIEIKPNYLLDDEVNIAKFNAADLYCRENGLEYVILTEDYLFNNGEPFYGSMPF